MHHARAMRDVLDAEPGGGVLDQDFLRRDQKLVAGALTLCTGRGVGLVIHFLTERHF
jgi:hypothetical protein